MAAIRPKPFIGRIYSIKGSYNINVIAKDKRIAKQIIATKIKYDGDLIIDIKQQHWSSKK